MGGEVLLFNRQINNKLSKNIFYFLSLFCFCRLPAVRRVSSPDANQIPISNKRAALLLCAALLFFSIRIYASVVLYCLSQTGFFNTHQRFCYSLLRQPDRWVHTKVYSVHKPIGAVRAIRTCLTDAVR